jgi:hypothetical protein
MSSSDYPNNPRHQRHRPRAPQGRQKDNYVMDHATDALSVSTVSWVEKHNGHAHAVTQSLAIGHSTDMCERKGLSQILPR